LGQDVVVTVSVPWVPPLELLLEEELLLVEEAPLDDELLLEEVELPLLELLEDEEDDEDVDPLLLEDGSEATLLPPPPQPAIARHATNTNGPNAVQRITPVCKWQRDERDSSAYNRKDPSGENVAV
jgi:hypothetical protein